MRPSSGWWGILRRCFRNRCRSGSAYFGVAAVDGGRASAVAGGVERDRSRTTRADKTLVQLFEEQVERTPEAVAVVYEGESTDLP